MGRIPAGGGLHKWAKSEIARKRYNTTIYSLRATLTLVPFTCSGRRHNNGRLRVNGTHVQGDGRATTHLGPSWAILDFRGQSSPRRQVAGKQ